MINFSKKTDALYRIFFLIGLFLFPLVGKSQWLRYELLSSTLFSYSSNAPFLASVLPQEARVVLNQNRFSLNDSSQEPIQGWQHGLYYLFLVMAATGFIPLLIFFIEHNLSGLHALSNHFKKCQNYCPRIAVIIPAWNEALVLEHTIDIFLKIDYPRSALRLYVIDDASTDNTREIMTSLQEAFPQNVFYVYKDSGGNGKAHAVNYGLNVILADSWTEAILLIDADISFKKDALRLMTRHLADADVGAVTAYIKVGNRQTTYITRSIGYEYIISEAVTRRAQNALGVIACLAGGAQLHTRANIEALGGIINTSTLAEDTYTTFLTQKKGKKVIYEGNAFVYAEEPKTIIDVWKQRFRWARGNLQITKAFKDVWFRSSSCLGNWFFGIMWFCVILTPVIMISSAIGLVGLFMLNKQDSAYLFFSLSSVSLFVYLYTTLFAILVDRRTSRLSWFEGIIYPGLISLGILFISINPHFFFQQLHYLFNLQSSTLEGGVLLFMESWSALCMLCAWIVFRLEFTGSSTTITNFLLLIVGYGPLLCTINLAAYIAEIKHPNLKWEKTEKISTKRVLYPHPKSTIYNFDKALYRDKQREYRFLCRQIISLIGVSGIFFLIFSF